MTATLFAHGCQRVALASVSASLYRTEEHDQAAGYYRCLSEHGVRLDKNLVLEGPHRQASLVEAAQLVGACLDAGYEFDGVVALGDRVALSAVNALKERGVAVGADMRVIGMDDSIYSRVSSPAISTVRRNTGQLAERGVEALLAMLAGKEPAQTRVVVPHEVIEHATTLGALGGHRLSFCCAVHEVFLCRWRTAIMEKVADLGCTQRNIDEAGHNFEAGQSRRALPEAISVHACCGTKAGQECGHSSS